MHPRCLPVLAVSTCLGALAAQEADGVGRAPRAQIPQQSMVRDEVPGPVTARSTMLGSPKALDMSLTPIHTQQPDPVGGDYGIWAAGRKYKVGFAGDMTFVPYLGAQYPHNQPFSWHTTSVRVGTTELLAAGELPAREQDQYQYRYRFGQVTETYDVRLEGLEQSFVFAARPAAAGDLVIEGRLDTALHGDQITGACQPARFFDAEERLILTYGAATAVDAAGRRTAVTTTVDGNLVRLQVDAKWLAEAAFPVTVDPIVTPTNIDWGSLRESMDICRDDTGNQRLYAFIRTASATDKDVYGVILADDYSTGTGAQVFNDITTSWSHDQVRCATAGSPQKYGIVYDRQFTNNTSAIRCHVHDSGNLSPSTTVFFFNWTSTIQDWRADVGGTSASTAGTKFMIAYQRDPGATLINGNNSEIWATTLDVSAATPVQGTPLQIARWGANADQDMERPSINKQATANANTIWMVVWQEYWNSQPTLPDDWDACGRLVDGNGNQSSSAWVTTHEGNQNMHQLGPVVAGAGGRYCVSYAFGDLGLINFKTGLINGTAVVTERVNWSSLATGPARFAEHILWGPHADRRWRVSDIGYDNNTDSHWAVCSVSDQAYVAAATGNVYIDRVGFNGIGLESATLYTGSPGFSGDPGGVAFDDDHDEMAVVWAQNDLSAASTTLGHVHDVFANSFSYPAVTAASLFGTACTAAAIAWRGVNAQQIGSEFSGISVTGAPANSLHFVLVSLGTQNIPVVNAAVWPGCRLLVQNVGGSFVGIMPLAIGNNVSEQLSLPEFLAPTTIHFQDWLLDPATNFFYSTQRLTVPIVK